ncbi:RDD family protein [Candidatus Uabimicrobium sp. HlEnr_7]|uniref:RDD family protein n=1 Tax=Candidatus Uabimicrobium helgolandensis TaxID=3095367 RepID=UPI00355754D1
MFSYIFNCPFCSGPVSVKTRLNPIGKKKKCSGCKKSFILSKENISKPEQNNSANANKKHSSEQNEKTDKKPKKRSLSQARKRSLRERKTTTSFMNQVVGFMLTGFLFSGGEELEKSQREERRVVIANYMTRIVAFSIDGFLFYLIEEGMLFFQLPYNFVTSHTLFVLYLVVMHTLFGATIGKKIVKIKIVGKDGGPLGFARVCLRALPFFLVIPWLVMAQIFYVDSTLIENSLMMFAGIGCWVAFFDFHTRAFHDILAKSYCIHANSKNTEKFFESLNNPDKEVSDGVRTSLRRSRLKKQDKKQMDFWPTFIAICVLSILLAFLFNAISPQNSIRDRRSKLKKTKTTAEQYYNEGMQLVRDKKVKKAIVQFEKCITVDKNFIDAYVIIGDIYYAGKNYNKAIVSYNRPINMDIKPPKIYVRRGRSYRALKNYDQALSDINIAIDLDENYADAYAERSKIYREKGLLETNSKYFKKSIEDYEKSQALRRK